MEPPTTARRILDLEAPERVGLTTRKLNARPTIMPRFCRSWRAALPPPSLAATSNVTRPSSSLAPSPGTAFLYTSSSSAKRRYMGTSDGRESSAWRIVLGGNCTTPASFVAVTATRALALFIKGFSVASVGLMRAPLALLAAMMVWCGCCW